MNIKVTYMQLKFISSSTLNSIMCYNCYLLIMHKDTEASRKRE